MSDCIYIGGDLFDSVNVYQWRSFYCGNEATASLDFFFCNDPHPLQKRTFYIIRKYNMHTLISINDASSFNKVKDQINFRLIDCVLFCVPLENFPSYGTYGNPWGYGLEQVPSIPLRVVRGNWMGRSFGWDRKNQGPVSQQVWHDKYTSLLKGPECRA